MKGMLALQKEALSFPVKIESKVTVRGKFTLSFLVEPKKKQKKQRKILVVFYDND